MIGVAIYVSVRGVLMLAGLVLGLGFGIVQAIVDEAGHVTSASSLSILGALPQWGLGLVDLLATFILSAASYRAALDVTDGRPYDFISALKRVPLSRVIGANLLIIVVLVAGMFLSILPPSALFLTDAPAWLPITAMVLIFIVSVVALSALLFFTTYAIVDNPTIGVTDAMRASARLVRANLGDAIVAGLLSGLLWLAGFLACCVGLFVAYPICTFAAAHAFRSFNGRTVAV